MKKIISFILTLTVLFSVTVITSANTLSADKINSTYKIGNFTVAATDGGEYLTDDRNNILGGPYKLISDYSGFPYAYNFDGSSEMYDADGKVFAYVEKEGHISPPVNGLYAILRDSDDWHLCKKFELYDYATKELLHTFDGTIMYYHELQHEKMFIYKDGKYAVCDKYGNFLTDYIYDNVQKRFNPDYNPFPKAYAIAEQNGVRKYIDWNLNEIDLDNYNGEPFITNSYRMRGNDGFENYGNFYMLESGSKYALYDLDTDKYIIPYQYDYKFLSMNDKYIIVKRGENEMGVIDYSGNAVVPLKNQQLSFNKDGLISYYYHDGETAHNGVLNPENGEVKESEPDSSGYFYKVIGQKHKEDIACAAIVYADDKAADISEEDLRKFIDVFWNFNYERVIAPIGSDADNGCYIKLWNKDKTEEYVIYPAGGVIAGAFGTPAESRGEIKKNYVWYLPDEGNGRNALYAAMETLRQNYRGKTRDITDADKISIPSENLLPVGGAGDWAEAEIQKAAACNLLPYELTDKYRNNITRKEFCDLIYRLAATEFSPDSDSRTGQWLAIDNVINERQLAEKVNSVSFSDCEDEKIKFLSGAGIIRGMGDGTFAPEEPVTREQAAAILYRTAEFLGNKTIPDAAEMSYADESEISDWAKSSVACMNVMGIMKGVSETEFSPKEPYTVEQAIAAMVRLYECY